MSASKENMQFSSYGRTWMIVVRGRWGRAFDRWLTRWTGFSAISLQYSLAGRRSYTPVLLFTTIGHKTLSDWVLDRLKIDGLL